MRIVATICSVILTFSPFSAMALVTLADTPNIPPHQLGGGSPSTSFTYTVPSGTNQVLIVRVGLGTDVSISATQNGAAITFVKASCDVVGFEYYGYLVAPTTGTFSITFGTANKEFIVYTVNGADQTNPIDSATCTNKNAASVADAITPTAANTFLMDWSITGNNINGSSHGASQTEYVNLNDSAAAFSMYSSYVQGSSTASTLQSMSENWSGAASIDTQVIAIKPFTAAAGGTTKKKQPIFFE